jgi:hypothetical protein
VSIITFASRALFSALSAVGGTVRRVVERWLFADAPRHTARGFELRDYRRAASSADAFAKLSEALEMIAQADPRRFSRMAKDIRLIVVTPLSRANAAYVPRSRTCYLNASVVEKHSTANVAILLVHEATHARIESFGVRQWPDLRRRFERLCVRQELTFAERLPIPTIHNWIERRKATSDAFR